jgi:HAUS augmin-like complex subunit 1
MSTQHNSSPTSNADISHLLSPTKARALLIESQSWRSVDTRLAKLFSSSTPNNKVPVPRFERNEATLAALLELLKANEDADEERRIVWEAEREALGEAKREGESKGKKVVNGGGVDLREGFLTDIESGLSTTGKTALDDLAAAAVLLASHSAMSEVEEMERRIMDLTYETFDAENELLRLRQTQKAFEREEVLLREAMARFDVEGEAEAMRSEEMQASTAALNREIKVVGIKLGEYQERIKGLKGYDIGNVKIEDVLQSEKKVGELQQVISVLEEKIMNMHGLPPDLDVSRKEVERAMNELDEWKKRRDRAFEGLME